MEENKIKSDQIPLVSVHIITYNQAHFIHDTLQSVLEQDYGNIEIVVADDGSTDGTDNIILDYASRYPGKIVPLVGGPNLGITINSNRALKYCNGKYIAFMGGDDLMLPGKLTAQMKFMLSHPHCVISYHDLDVFDSATGMLLRRLNSGKDSMLPLEGGVDKFVEYGTFLGACSVICKRDACPPHGFDPRIPIASDWLFWIETTVSGGEVRYLPEVLGKYRRHDKNVTRHKNDYTEQYLTLAVVDGKYPHLFKHTKNGRARIWYARGVAQVLLGNGKDGRKHFRKSIREGWYSWKILAWYLKSYLRQRVI